MALITVGAVALPNPTSYKVKFSDLDSDSTSRSEAGVLHRDRIRAGIRRIDVTWSVGKADYETIAAALAPAKISVTFFDPGSGTMQTTDMYAGDRDASLTVYMDEAHPERSRWDLSAALIEF